MGHAEWADALVWKVVEGVPGDDAELRAKLHHLHMVQWAYLHIWRAEPVRPRELSSFPGLPRDPRVGARVLPASCRRTSRP